MTEDRTARQEIEALLRGGAWTVRDLALHLGRRVRDVEDDVRHVARSAGRKALRVEPATCRGCGFGFTKRDRLTAPSRCPRCRSEQIDGPHVALAPPATGA